MGDRPQWPQRHAVAHLIDHAGALRIHDFEAVRVMPERIGPPLLKVHKEPRSLKLQDPRTPAHRNAQQSDFVLDHSLRVHRDRAWGQRPEPKKARRQGIQIFRSREICEDLLQRAIDDLFRPQGAVATFASELQLTTHIQDFAAGTPADALAKAHNHAIARLEAVSRRYERGEGTVQALREVSLAVRAGEWLALVGPSGCGKSTLLNLLSGVDQPSSGRAEVLGVDLARGSERERALLRRRSIGIVFQAFHLVPHLSVAENVALPLALDRKRDPARVQFLLERVGLAERARHLPSELSGGEQQRVAIARGLVHRPRLIVADEPTGNLDSANGVRVLELLDELRREAGAALVVATHDRALAQRADRVARLKDGALIGWGLTEAG